MERTCEHFRIKADKIFDKLELKEGLEMSDINDLYKQFIRAKAKEFEICHILRIHLKNLKKEKQKIIDMKVLMKEDTLWNKIFPDKENEHREIIGKTKKIYLPEIREHVKKFMKENFCHLLKEKKRREHFTVAKYLESIVEQ